MSKIIFNQVTKSYDKKQVIKDLSLSFPDFGFVSIMGASGSGKTTILNLILGLTEPDAGQINVTGKVSVLFQEDRLLPWIDVLANVMLPFESSADYKTKEEEAIHILSELGLSEDIHSMPSELSGGMSRRVSIARTLLVDADIYIMDEPSRGLDDATRKSVLEFIHKKTDLACDQAGQSLNRLLIMVTHNSDEAEGSYVIPML